MTQHIPETVAVLHSTIPIYVGNSRFHGKPVLLTESKQDNYVYALRSVASTDDLLPRSLLKPLPTVGDCSPSRQAAVGQYGHLISHRPW